MGGLGAKGGDQERVPLTPRNTPESSSGSMLWAAGGGAAAHSKGRSFNDF
jgi:hypothetical protein